MKSLGLALTLFVLTGALAALDLSGAHQVQPATEKLAQPTSASATRITGKTSPAVTSSEQDEAATDDDEAASEIINAFLVTPRSLAPANIAATTTLRYD